MGKSAVRIACTFASDIHLPEWLPRRTDRSTDEFYPSKKIAVRDQPSEIKVRAVHPVNREDWPTPNLL